MNKFESLDAQSAESHFAQVTTEEIAEMEAPPVSRKSLHPDHREYLRVAGKAWAKGKAILESIHAELAPEMAEIRAADEMLIDTGV